MAEWLQIVLALISAISTGTLIITLVTLNAKKRQENAAAGKSEAELRVADIDAEFKETEFADQRLKKAYETIARQDKVIDDLQAQILEFKRIQTKLKLELIAMNAAKEVAELKYKRSRCDNFSCLSRIPPIES